MSEPSVRDRATFELFCSACLRNEVGAEIRDSDLVVRYKDWVRFNPGTKMITKKALLAMMDQKYEKCDKIYKDVLIVDDDEDVPVPVPVPVPAPIKMCDMVCDMFRQNIRDKMYPMTVSEAERFVRDLSRWLSTN